MMRYYGTLLAFLLAVIYLTAWFVQDNIFISGDVINGMHISDQFLLGGTYKTSFFESNPPWFIYCYIPPVLISKLFFVNYILSARIYFFIISLISLQLCYPLIAIIAKKNATYNKYILIPAIAVINVLVPVFDFGQREHYMLMLLLPYLVATVFRLEGGSISLRFATLIGFFAGIGFCFKPHFLIAWILVEFIYCIKTSFRLRPESITIFLILIAYGLMVLLFHRDYIFYMLPYVFHYFYAWFDTSHDTLLKQLSKHAVVISLMSLLFYFILLKNDKNKNLEMILSFAIIGLIISYFLQKTSWQHYHIYPALALGCLLLIQLCYRSCIDFLKENVKNNRKQNIILWLACGIILFILSYPFYYIYGLICESVEWRVHGELAELNHHLQVFPKNSSIYFFSNALLPYPTADYLNFVNNQITQMYWYLPGVMKAHNNDEAILLKMVVNDFVLKNPDVIVFDNRIIWGGEAFDFLSYFSKDQFFRSRLAHYKLIDSYKTIQIYKKNQ